MAATEVFTPASGMGVAPPRQRRNVLFDIAKAFAIIFVVIGHFRPDNAPEAYNCMIDVIYMFHMPLFMFVSGYIYAVYSRHPSDFESYRSFAAKKFRRLMIPYFVTSLLLLAIKFVTGQPTHLEDHVTLRSLFGIFYYPSAGYFLWFVWALWWMMLIVPLFSTPRRRLLLLLVAVLLFYVSDSLTNIFCINCICRYLVFFSLGTCIGDYLKHRESGVNTAILVSCVPAFAVLAWLRLKMPHIDNQLINLSLSLAVNLSGIAMVLSLSWLYMSFVKRGFPVVLSLSAASFIIYLFHTTFEGFAKNVLAKVPLFSSGPELMFYIGALIVVAVGVAGPWLLYLYVFRRYRVARYLFGL